MITPKEEDKWEVSTLAGSGTAGFADRQGREAQFDNPFGVAVDSKGNIYVADTFNHRIRKITPKEGGRWEVSTLAGSSTEGFADGQGRAAQFKRPYGVDVDSKGNIYVADYYNHSIRMITPKEEDKWEVSTLAGSGTEGFADGQGRAAQFNRPHDVDVDSKGNVYVADYRTHRIRMITPKEEDKWEVSTLAGSGAQGSANGQGTAAQFNYPAGVAVDSKGNVYVADKDNHRIRKIEYRIP